MEPVELDDSAAQALTAFWSLVERVVFDPALGPILKLSLVLILIALVAYAWRRGSN